MRRRVLTNKKRKKLELALALMDKSLELLEIDGNLSIEYDYINTAYDLVLQCK